MVAIAEVRADVLADTVTLELCGLDLVLRVVHL